MDGKQNQNSNIENGNTLNIKQDDDQKSLLKQEAKGQDTPQSPSTKFYIAGVCYCATSVTMIVLNKASLSNFEFDCPVSLVLFQCLVAVSLVKIFQILNIIKLESFKWSIVKIWFPVNLLFVGMLSTSFLALDSLNVAMVTVLKNLTNIFVIAGDIYFYKKSYGWSVWATISLMIVSAICGGITDLEFNFWGYFWQIINCLFTASYSLYLRKVMDEVKELTDNKKKLDEFSMVFYNNLLSLPVLLVTAIIIGEAQRLSYQPAIYNSYFQIAAIASALCGFLISFASLWFLASTTATIYSLVGSLNKIPVAILGITLFKAKTSIQNILSITISLVAGIIFVRAKSFGSAKS